LPAFALLDGIEHSYKGLDNMEYLNTQHRQDNTDQLVFPDHAVIEHPAILFHRELNLPNQAIYT
jgi:hypothetical protein